MQVNSSTPNKTITQSDTKLTLTQNNDSVTASGTGLSGWAYLTSSSDPDCDGDASYTGSTQTASSISDGHWVCFKAKDSSNVWSYAELQVDLTQPSLTLSQANDKIKATGTNLVGYVYFTQSSDPTCDGTGTYDGTGQTTATMTDDHWACFKAKNGLGVYGYAELQIDRTKPSFTLNQDNTTISMSTTTGLSDIGYFEASSEPPATGATSCSDDKTSGWTADADGSISGVANNKWICFRGKNDLGVYGYAKRQVNRSKPSFTLSQDDQTVSMSTTTGLSGIGYFEASSEPPSTGATSCSDDKTTGWTADSDGSIDSIADNKWICFRGKNDLGVYGYAKLQVDLTKPSLTLAQASQTVTASGTGLSDFQYLTSATNPDCDADDTYGNTGKVASSITYTHWVCFKAKNSLGVYGFAELQVNSSTPNKTITQSDTKLTLTQNNDSVTASGTGLSGWAYLTSSSDPDCDGDASYTGSTQTASSISDGHWVCFKAKDSSNAWSYAELQVDLTQPSLTLSQANDKIKATGTNLVGYVYFTQSSDPTCDSSGTYDGTGQTTATMTDDHWACFKAKNGLGVYGYAELQIDRTKPSFTLNQDNTTISMSTTTGLSDIGYFEASSEPASDRCHQLLR